MKHLWKLLVVTDYYIAAILLIYAGISKLSSPGVGDLLESLFDGNTLTLDQLIFISRWFPPFEILVGVLALSGIQAVLVARFIGIIYLFFILLLFYISEGYLLLPVDCGCFGEGDATPVYLLILRNSALALPLFFFSKSYYHWTLFFHISRKKRKPVA